MLEKTLQNRIRKDLKSKGWLVYYTDSVIKGFSDITAFKNGRTIFLEIKKDKGSKIGFYQARFIKMMRDNGFTAEIIKTYDEYVGINLKEG